MQINCKPDVWVLPKLLKGNNVISALLSLIRNFAPGAAVSALKEHVLSAIQAAVCFEQPCEHWNVTDFLPASTIQAIRALPYAPPAEAETHGKREAYNGSRVFLSSSEARAKHPVAEEMVQAFLDPALRNALTEKFGTPVTSGRLRIEYCQDRDGYWNAPHCDIKEKLITMQVYLNDEPAMQNLGTDFYSDDLSEKLSHPAPFGSANIFVPGRGSWHGFEKRPITGIRRSVIINYVSDEFRAVQELADETQGWEGES